MKEERKRILEMVERGSLSATEAITLLEELEKSTQSAGQKEQEIINELAVVVNEEEDRKTAGDGPYKSSSPKDKLFDLLETAIKKIRELDLDFNFGQSVEVSHIFHQNAVSLKDIDVSIANGSIKLLPWDQQNVRAEVQARVYRVDNQDEARKELLDSVVFNVEDDRLRFIAQHKWMKVDTVLYVPDAAYEKVRAKLFNGPVSGENLKIEDLKAKTGNGKVSFKNVNGRKLEAETANGHIEVNGCELDKLEVETINGGVKVDGSIRTADLRTFNGGIRCELQGASEYITAKTTTGGIEIYVPEGTAIDGELRSNLGGFEVDLDRIQLLEEKSEMIQKLLRFKTIQEASQPAKIIVETKTGGISIKKSIQNKQQEFDI
ncbi:DUF4097 domain-containing protein [Neobacillus notoginsengisoli]|uniref:DUF4097 domain-containing protein n=1 Tax=Neobacillus notoginsengisoli TaxID=1578198 RepID=A0A417YSC8_9BACI|nr:DUF4097 domain-containing protein [Neobacillus notoginsengisoli]RHW38908.1 DUF4097 domain-containing protein [Neobacillus notoginsengisoli]